MNRLLSLLLLATSLMAATACSDNKTTPAPVTAALPAVTGAFSGAQEVPAVASAATGTFTGTLDKTTRELRFTITFAGISPTIAHLHLGAPGTKGNIFLPFPFNNATSDGFDSPITGTSILSPAQAAALVANGVYANLHSAAQPGGEIRADLSVK
jgi:hypothetical protein